MKKIDFEKTSEWLKALAHPLRLKIVTGLMQKEECNVGKMVESLGLPQSTVSQQLKILKQAGVIDCRKDGVKTCYYVADRRIEKLLILLGDKS